MAIALKANMLTLPHTTQSPVVHGLWTYRSPPTGVFDPFEQNSILWLTQSSLLSSVSRGSVGFGALLSHPGRIQAILTCTHRRWNVRWWPPVWNDLICISPEGAAQAYLNCFVVRKCTHEFCLTQIKSKKTRRSDIKGAARVMSALFTQPTPQ